MPETALDRVKPKLKVDKLVDNLVSGHFETLKEAARNAGFAESTLQSAIYQYTRSPSFIGKVAKKTRKRRDKALAIAGAAGDHVLDRLESKQACDKCGQMPIDDALALAAWRESTKIINEQGLTDKQLISPQRRRWYAMRRYKLALRMLKLGMSLSPRASYVLTMLNAKLGLAEPVQVEHD